MGFKVCNICKNNLPLDSFYKNRFKKDNLQSFCKKCNSIRVRAHYRKDPKKVMDRNKIRREINRVYIYEFLLKNPCFDCGESDPIVLEFDHVRDKKRKSISQMVVRFTPKSIQYEIDKCEVRCANCHRRKTAHSFNYSKVKMSLPSSSEVE